MLDWIDRRVARNNSRKAMLLEDVKQQLGVTFDDDDTLLLRLIDAATLHIEDMGAINCALTSTNFELWASAWPCPFQLPRWPLTGVRKIEYYDEDEALQTWATSEYDVVLRDRQPSSVHTKPDKLLPALGKTAYPVRIDYDAGFSETPANVQMALAFLVRHWYDNPSAVVVGTISSEIKLHLSSILKSMKVGAVPGAWGSSKDPNSANHKVGSIVT